MDRNFPRVAVLDQSRLIYLTTLLFWLVGCCFFFVNQQVLHVSEKSLSNITQYNTDHNIVQLQIQIELSPALDFSVKSKF